MLELLIASDIFLITILILLIVTRLKVRKLEKDVERNVQDRRAVVNFLNGFAVSSAFSCYQSTLLMLPLIKKMAAAAKL